MSSVSLVSTIPKHLPGFIQEDHPMFVSFVEAYFEYLERENGPVSFIRNSLDYVSPRDSLDEFITNFFEEMKAIPKSVIADKRILAEHIFELYQAKGTVKSFELFFRMMFNENVQIHFPKDNMIKSSDGVWVRDITIRILPPEGVDPFSLIANRIYQYDQYNAEIASANVENVIGQESGYYDLVCSPNSIAGTFSFEHPITFGGNLFQITPAPEFTTPINRGSGYSLGDAITTTNGYGILADVNAILSGPITRAIIIDGGSGYSVGDQLSVISDTGIDSDLRVADVDESGCITEIVVLSGGQGYDEFAIVDLDDGLVVCVGDRIGSVGSIKISDPGYGYLTPPDASINTVGVILPQAIPFEAAELVIVQPERMITQTGWEVVTEDGDAILSEEQSDVQFDVLISNVGPTQATFIGVIQRIDFTTEDGGAILSEDGSGFVMETSTDSIYQRTIIGSESGAKTRILYINPANVNSEVSAKFDSGLRFKGVAGNLSETTQVLQDSRYYQEFSYVIRSGQSIDIYRNAIQTLLHPAGLAMFGAINIESRLDLIPKAITALAGIVVRMLDSYSTLEYIARTSTITIESTITVPTNLFHSTRWMDMNKFILGTHDDVIVGTNVTAQRLVPENTNDENRTVSIYNISSLTFNDVYTYSDSILGITDYSDPIFNSAYYTNKLTRLNIGWDAEINGVGDVWLTTQDGDILATEDSIYQIIL